MARTTTAHALAATAALAALAAPAIALPAAAAATDTVAIATIATAATTPIATLLATTHTATTAETPAQTATETPAQAATDLAATATADLAIDLAATATETIAETAPTEAATEAAPAEAAGPVAIDVNCAGTQDQIDTCLGATNYTPVSDYLGVPYYAQHNGMGGEAWLALETGDQVEADGTTYTIIEIRTVATGGDIDQIAGMKADAYLQTCLDDNIHSNVYALATA